MRSTLQAYYHTMDDGWDEHDVTKAYTYYSDDFVTVGAPDETLNLDDLKGFANRIFQVARLVRSDSAIVSFTATGGGYAAVVRQHLLLKGVSRESDGTQMARVDAFVETRDFWQKTAAGWQVIRSRPIRVRELWNGKEVNPDDLAGPAGSDSNSTGPATPGSSDGTAGDSGD